MIKKKFYKMLLARGIQRNEAQLMTAMAARQKFLLNAGYGLLNLDEDYDYSDFLNDRSWIARNHYWYQQAKHKDKIMKQLREAANIAYYDFFGCRKE